MFAIAELWKHGWQPAELIRRGRRFEARAGRLLAAAIAADHLHRPDESLHPRWAEQLAALDLPKVAATSGWLPAFNRAEDLGPVAALSTAITALRALHTAGPVHVILPPPGASAAAMAQAARAPDDPVLAKVRALLSQAESTTYDAEAESFTAKAHELMARHAIDSALLWAATPRDERPTTIRIPIDDPYAAIKSLLLQLVAGHSRCKAVYDEINAWSSVIGFASDVAATEVLFTSLLVQSQVALTCEAAKSAPGGRTRSRNFRSSFLMAYIRRVDQRLAEINSVVENAAADQIRATGKEVLPVLASRAEAVEAAVAEVFGELRHSAVRGGTDPVGWARGELAGGLAKLNAADLASSMPAPRGLR